MSDLRKRVADIARKLELSKQLDMKSCFYDDHRTMLDYIAKLEAVARAGKWYAEHRGVSSEHQFQQALKEAGFGDA